MNKKNTTRRETRERRRVRVRSKISGTLVKPRLNVHRSLIHIYGQLIDDIAGQTLVAVHSKSVDKKGDVGSRKGKTAVAYLVGKEIAKQAQEKGIKTIVFDRAGYKYQGRTQAVADGARDGGLEF
ncbi:50S ribosomal protein L18 [Patescibacteria group bacterium]|nr:50S ribosomal protein L18 [Patescibacteria group bacterium]